MFLDQKFTCISYDESSDDEVSDWDFENIPNI